MKAYVSLHTARPDFQIDSEVSYAGYERVEIDFDANFAKEPTGIIFPIIEDQKSEDVAIYAAVGQASCGQGEIFMRVPLRLHIVLKDQPERRTRELWLKHGVAEDQVDSYIENHGHVAPRILFHDERPPLPDALNPIARVAHDLIFSGLITANDLHPKLYEAINDALFNAGVPVIQVVRSGAAKMEGKWSQMPNLNDMVGTETAN